MHTGSRVAMQQFIDTHLIPMGMAGLRVLDVGSLDVNGTYREPFGGCEYIGLDIEAGPNVDIVAQDQYSWPIEDEFFDVVISGQAFEHIEWPWMIILEVERVLKPGGLCCLIAPMAGVVHRYPIDCWRILPDGWRALAKWAGLDVIAVNEYQSPDWIDIALIAKKGT